MRAKINEIKNRKTWIKLIKKKYSFSEDNKIINFQQTDRLIRKRKHQWHTHTHTYMYVSVYMYVLGWP